MHAEAALRRVDAAAEVLDHPARDLDVRTADEPTLDLELDVGLRRAAGEHQRGKVLAREIAAHAWTPPRAIAVRAR